jgi:hypothetical protein
MCGNTDRAMARVRTRIVRATLPTVLAQLTAARETPVVLWPVAEHPPPTYILVRPLWDDIDPTSHPPDHSLWHGAHSVLWRDGCGDRDGIVAWWTDNRASVDVAGRVIGVLACEGLDR